MAKITITTDDGELMAHFTEREIGDMSKPLAKADLMDSILMALKRARSKDCDDAVEKAKLRRRKGNREKR